MLRHHPKKPYHDIKSSIATGMSYPWENFVPTEDPRAKPKPVATKGHCRDKGPEFSVATEKFSISTETRKWAVAYSGLLHLQFPFSFLSKTPKIQYKIAILLQKHYEIWENLARTAFIIQMSLITTLFFLHKQKLCFLPKIYKI